MKIVVFANSVYTNTLTGGDRIFAESAKLWLKWGHDVRIVTNEAGLQFCQQVGISRQNVIVWNNSWADKFGVFSSMFLKAVVCTFKGLFLSAENVDVVFASSFFEPDIVPAIFLKLRNPGIKISTACYLFTTKKLGSDYSGGKLKGFLFYINEVIAFFLMRWQEGKILTASAFDRKQFIKSSKFPARKVLAVRGGVDNEFFASVPKQTDIYDGLFIGRLHPQKCIDELIEIWGLIVKTDSKVKLAIVGSGPQEQDLKKLVRQRKLSKNIFFLGPKDGIEKTKIIKSSRVFVSTSRFDSGNIALDEALSCGIPGVVYDLPRLDYPGGVIKIPIGDHILFAKETLQLLTEARLRKRLSDEALAFALKLDWNTKAKQLLIFLAK